MRVRSESGYVLVTVAAMLVVLIGFTGLALDLGTMLSARTQMQRAADAAALAGAYSLVVAPTDENGLFNGDVASAKAVQVATLNSVMGDPVLASEVTTAPLPPDQPTRGAQMQVTIRRSLPTFFARVLDINVLSVSSSQSIAEVGPEATGSKCVKPFFIPNSVFATTTDCNARAAGQLLVSNNQTTTYAAQNFGKKRALVPDSGQQGAKLSSSQYFNLAFANNASGNVLRDAIGGCTTTMVCRTTYAMEPGKPANSGPISQGITTLLGNSPDQYVGPGRYRRPDGTIHDTSRSLVMAPIGDLDLFPGFCPGDHSQVFNGNNNSLTVVGFALIFIDGPGIDPLGISGVTGEIIDVLPCGDAAPSGNQLDGTIYGFPIRLVRPIS